MSTKTIDLNKLTDEELVKAREAEIAKYLALPKYVPEKPKPIENFTGYRENNEGQCVGYYHVHAQPTDTATVKFFPCDLDKCPPIYVSWESYQEKAQIALDKVTGPRGTVMRCLIAGVSLPEAWLQYISTLRAVLKSSTGTPGTLPSVPDYPAGT